ncbi:MAG: hypothetical protein A3K19_33355 [Lentisphaerae bacterium RIFOXYB12_FULL_65_16]|nr:MAG: hypothetical protein A3K18_05840 [Lentisphaerae bacterium RIFOXYA12_64_32]OGV86918.1 MAG: hypothetical protein A3K19_33355 [Lentisphaerae bacterium RIFOXYB12_FULL_65_16]
MPDQTPLKVCPKCGTLWQDRNALLDDPCIGVIGYQPNFDDLEAGFFLFNHNAPACGTTFAIAAGQFTDLYHGPIFKERLTGTPQCPGHCLHEDDLEPCPNRCECAYVRAVLQIVKNWHPRTT